jgi:aminoglycoside 2'-N-acetyltransferase I
MAAPGRVCPPPAASKAWQNRAVSQQPPDLPAVPTMTVLPTGAPSPADRAAIVALCTRAFGTDFSSLWHYVRAADHVLATLDGRLVGHAMWSTRTARANDGPFLRTAYLDAMATDAEMWGQGIGRAVIACLGAETAGFDLRALSTDRPGFYERLCWERWRGPTGGRDGDLLIPTPEEIVFISRTSTTPPLDLDGLLTVERRAGSIW